MTDQRQYLLYAPNTYVNMSSHSPTRLDQQGPSNQTRTDSAKPLVQFFAQSGEGITGKRIQLLCFYAEALYHDKYDERLTKVEYRPYMYGMHSNDIETAIEELAENDRIEPERVIINDHRTKLYNTTIEPATLTNSEREFLTDIHNSAQDSDLTDLAQWAKNHPLSEQTDYNTPTDFTTLD